MIAVLMSILLSISAFSQELIERSYSGVSKNPEMAEARREIQEQITQQITEDLAKQFLGETDFIKNRNTVMNKIAKNSGRFIPFQKPGKLQTLPDGFAMTVEVRLNPNAFRQLLQQNGLLNENHSAPVLLPLIQVVDRVQLRSDRWWAQDEGKEVSALRSYSRNLESSLRSAFSKAGFFVIRPVALSMSESMPQALRNEKHSVDDLRILSNWFGSALAIDGILQINRPREGTSAAARIDLRLQVVQMKDGRPIADVSRSFDTDPGVLEVAVDRKLREIAESVSNDLASQVAEAWQKGSVGSSQIRLTFTPRLSLPEIEKLKQALTTSNLGLRSVRERLVTSSGVTFEVETPTSLPELARRLDTFQFQGKGLKVQPADNEIRVQLTR